MTRPGTPPLRRSLVSVALVVVGVAASPGAARAYICPDVPLQERIKAAEIVFVGRSVGSRAVAGSGIPQRLHTFEVDQRVRGPVGRTVAVRIPLRPENGGQRIPQDTAAGIMANRVGSGWYTTRCGITDPGAVLAAADEPRGNAIKLVLGVLILAAVLAYSVRRAGRGHRGSGRGSLAG